MADLALCIPTFKRVQLLTRLLKDLGKQSVQPGCIIVVDGDPSPGEVLRALEGFEGGSGSALIYVPSNHGNLPFQRYLGWRVAAAKDRQFLVYLDDDLRISDPHALGHLIEPMCPSGSGVVGCTGEIRFGDPKHSDASQGSSSRRHDFSHKLFSCLVKLLGSSRGLQPGDLAPSGHRCPVENSPGGAYATVQWLRGGVMAYRMSALDEDCFSSDLFAAYETRSGRGEDTLLSRRVGSRGRLIVVFGAVFEHPNADAPKAYPTKPYRMACNSAYSRRLLSDNYRWPGKPTIQDRFALLTSYVGNTVLSFHDAVRSPNPDRFAYSLGYFLGAIKGVLQPPSHRRLTPDIDWHGDAKLALGREIVF